MPFGAKMPATATPALLSLAYLGDTWNLIFVLPREAKSIITVVVVTGAFSKLTFGALK